MDENQAEIPHKEPDIEKELISNAHPVTDNDLARNNIENDMPAADLEDL